MTKTKLVFSPVAWDQYLFWQGQDKKTLKKINSLIKEMMRTPFEGTGKPEPLKGDLQGFMSRRIDEKNRIIYAVDKDSILIVRLKGHYDDN
jgi:toxin YoeB